MRKLACLVGLGMLFLLAQTAAAQDTPKVDAFLGYSYVRANPETSGAPSFNLHGGSASVAYNVSNSLGLVADFGGYHVNKIGGFPVDSAVYTYLFGPRLSYRRSESKLTPYAQILFGGTHLGRGALQAGSDNAFAMTVGGGLDANPTRHIGLRLGQVEYLMTRFKEATPNRVTQNNLRFSTGIVFRW